MVLLLDVVMRTPADVSTNSRHGIYCNGEA